jgi:hypothetical protein
MNGFFININNWYDGSKKNFSEYDLLTYLNGNGIFFSSVYAWIKVKKKIIKKIPIKILFQI